MARLLSMPCLRQIDTTCGLSSPRSSMDNSSSSSDSVFEATAPDSPQLDCFQGDEIPVSIFLTGATGFLGKVVLEDLLRHRSEYKLSQVFVLTRAKNGCDSHERFRKKVLSSPCFSKLLDPKEAFESVHVVVGDLSTSACGMSPHDYQMVSSSITHIIHCAASVDFELPIIEAARANCITSLNVLELAKKSPNLRRMVSTSTAYVTPHRDGPIEEALVDFPWPAQQLFDDIMSERKLEAEVLAATRHPNTYTFTKALAERLLAERGENVPLTVVRPSIISTSRKYPFPGWVDSQAAFTAFAATYGAGLLRVCDVDSKTRLDIVPVDDVARRIIDEALLLQRRPSTSHPPVIYAVASLRHSASIASILDIMTTTFRALPNAKNLSPTAAHVGPRNTMFHVQKFLHHTCRLGIAGLWYRFRDNKAMARSVERQKEILEVLNRVFLHFTHHTYDFRPSVALDEGFVVGDYLEVVCRGVSDHLLSRV